ncbi:MAG: FkbM family methyltransferase [Anaerolineales bacterium]|nr:FkbM family methyltransferase [Anaerolineales bacterium]
MPNMARKILQIRKLLQALSNSLWRKALRHGVVPSVEHTKVLQGLPEIKCVVDVGANRGQFALLARKFWPNAILFSFEPLSEPVELFRKIFYGDGRAHIYLNAIGTAKGNMLMHVSKADDSSSLLPITDLQAEIFPGTEEREQREVRVLPLGAVLTSAQIEKPALLKIDVQGSELNAINGSQTLIQCFEYLYVECSFMELYEGQATVNQVFLTILKEGFSLISIHNLTHDKFGRAIQADFLFKRGTDGRQ